MLFRGQSKGGLPHNKKQERLRHRHPLDSGARRISRCHRRLVKLSFGERKRQERLSSSYADQAGLLHDGFDYRDIRVQ